MPNRRVAIRSWKYLLTLGRPGPDLSWVTEMMAVSGTIRPGDYGWLEEQGFEAVVDLREEDRGDPELLQKNGISFLHLPTRDHFPPTQEQLLDGSQWTLERLESNQKTVIYCKEGIGRSVALAACVLMRSGHYLADALILLRAKRFGVALNLRQMEALLEFERHLLGDQNLAGWRRRQSQDGA